jgi:signal transduction histidine kinase
LCKDFQKIYNGIGIERQIDATEEDVPEHLKIVIFRLLQEALNNIAKHSRAKQVRILLSRTIDRLVLVISDDGGGFDLEYVISRAQSMKGLGLASMKERTEFSGGSFSIDSEKGSGTTVHASWDCKKGDGEGASKNIRRTGNTW